MVVTLGFILSFFRLQDIRLVSYFANFFALFIAFILLFQLPDYYASLSTDPEIQYFIFSKELFPAFGIALFAYANHFSLISIIKILNRDSFLTKFKVQLPDCYSRAVYSTYALHVDFLCRLSLFRQQDSGIHRQQTESARTKRYHDEHRSNWTLYWHGSHGPCRRCEQSRHNSLYVELALKAFSR